jgi:hypothetical protein
MTVAKHRKQHTVPLEFQLVFEGKLKLLLHAAQDVCEIADKLGKVKMLASARIGYPYRSANSFKVPWIPSQGLSNRVLDF